MGTITTRWVTRKTPKWGADAYEERDVGYSRSPFVADTRRTASWLAVGREGLGARTLDLSLLEHAIKRQHRSTKDGHAERPQDIEAAPTATNDTRLSRGTRLCNSLQPVSGGPRRDLHHRVGRRVRGHQRQRRRQPVGVRVRPVPGGGGVPGRLRPGHPRSRRRGRERPVQQRRRGAGDRRRGPAGGRRHALELLRALGRRVRLRLRAQLQQLRGLRRVGHGGGDRLRLHVRRPRDLHPRRRRVGDEQGLRPHRCQWHGHGHGHNGRQRDGYGHRPHGRQRHRRRQKPVPDSRRHVGRAGGERDGVRPRLPVGVGRAHLDRHPRWARRRRRQGQDSPDRGQGDRGRRRGRPAKDRLRGSGHRPLAPARPHGEPTGSHRCRPDTPGGRALHSGGLGCRAPG
jgi:hypothetical protein